MEREMWWGDSMKLNYEEEAELICRLLAGRGIELYGVCYDLEIEEQDLIPCEDKPFDEIAKDICATGYESFLIIEYGEDRRWIRFILGNDFGEIIHDSSTGKEQIDLLRKEALKEYKHDTLSFKDICKLFMLGPTHYTTSDEVTA
mgnify:CR=1 FL=1